MRAGVRETSKIRPSPEPSAEKLESRSPVDACAAACPCAVVKGAGSRRGRASESSASACNVMTSRIGRDWLLPSARPWPKRSRDVYALSLSASTPPTLVPDILRSLRCVSTLRTTLAPGSSCAPSCHSLSTHLPLLGALGPPVRATRSINKVSPLPFIYSPLSVSLRRGS